MQFIPKTPLVSIVIINWNYAKFVGRTIASVKRQTYPKFECIVVDNGSTDDSVAVISDAIAADDRFRLHRMPENYGHLGAALAILDELKGEFINFLDADDILFEHFLASHLQVHLASQAPVSFTSSDVITIDQDDVVIGAGNYYIGDLCRELVRCLPATRSVALSSIDAAYYSRLREATHEAPPHIGHWCWSPGSANVIRRDLAIALKPANVKSPILLGGVDAYLLFPLFGLTGCNLINAPLMAYRIHGANDHSRTPTIKGVKGGNEPAYLRNSAIKRMLLIDVIEKFEMLAGMVAPSRRYFDLLRLIEENHADSVTIARVKLFSDKEVRQALAKNYSAMVDLFGERAVIRELRRMMKLKDLLAILFLAHKNVIPFHTLRRTATIELRRKRRA